METSGVWRRREGAPHGAVFGFVCRDETGGEVVCFAGDPGQMKDEYGLAATHYTLCIVLCASTAASPTSPSSVGMNGDGGGITERPDLEVRRELESFFPQSNDL